VPGHTWKTDLADLDKQLLGYLTTHGVPASAVVSTGSQELEWAEDGAVTLTTDYSTVVTVPNGDGTVITTVTETHKGPSTGNIFLNGPVAVPRDWDGSAFAVEITTDVNGAPAETPPFAIPRTVLDDTVALELTCSGKTMTSLAHNALVTITWTRCRRSTQPTSSGNAGSDDHSSSEPS
jgi:hypothetical protein